MPADEIQVPDEQKESHETQDLLHRPLPQVQIDYVIVFSLSPLNKHAATDKAVQAAALKEEYANLMSRLNAAGLTARGRPGAKGSDELLILVTCQNESRIVREVEGERMSDWLHGITFAKPHSQLDSAPFSQPYTPSERLRHLYNIITQDAIPESTDSPISPQSHRTLAGPGAGITPGRAPFEHVKSIFPPHDIGFNNKWISQWSDRSHFSIHIPHIELDQIKDVYGEAIGYYFAFLNFYFQMLMLPTGTGFIAWAFGLKFSSTYSVCLILWSLVVVEMWTVKERLLAIRWNSLSCHKVEKWRVQFKPERIVKNVVTNEPMGYFPWWKREARMMVTAPVLILFAIGLTALITAITAIELIVGEVYNGPFKQVMSLLPTVLFAAFVPQLVTLWQSIAMRLVAWENHTYESAYGRSLTIKMFIVHALVAYASLILTAFVYVPFGSLLVPHLGELTHKFIKNDAVPLEGQAVQYLDSKALNRSTYSINNERLYQQLFAYTVTNQVVNSFTEIGLPYLMKVASFKYHKIVEERQKKGSNGDRLETQAPIPDFEDEVALLERLREEAGLPEYHLFVEYAEMAIQFGYIVVWTVVWPIAPLFAFVNNFFELRTDAIKLTKQSRRPVPTRSDSIGPWLDVLRSLTWFGAVVNTALVYLFKPSHHTFTTSASVFQQHLHAPLNSSLLNTEPMASNRTIFTNLLEATIIENKRAERSSKSSSPNQLYKSISSILLSSLVPVLFSEHAYRFARSVVKHTVNRLMWLDSDAFITQSKADWELKQSFLSRLDQSWSIISPSTQQDNSSARQNEDVDSGTLSNERFWSRLDLGMDEINRLAKTD
ncbi:hypothetical protein CROQUDRAFT_651552 [Cronartium quercuum f. sp. fusiforme G11]|uniref:Uncharacterized protein n=1 Tax=Cronartium quercuum f. sp. fusiforme G11 TaxID=708437 RepID=A0A9P6NPQ4_9BASI|nr:hypothetical protein CROQUDRAFT_651552 [Cronartium quercuum f. sp. fusiforme G11]